MTASGRKRKYKFIEASKQLHRLRLPNTPQTSLFLPQADRVLAIKRLGIDTDTDDEYISPSVQMDHLGDDEDWDDDASFEEEDGKDKRGRTKTKTLKGPAKGPTGWRGATYKLERRWGGVEFWFHVAFCNLACHGFRVG